MKRPVALVVAVLLVTAACSSGDDDDEAAPTTTTSPPVLEFTTTTTIDVNRVEVSDACVGIGAAHANGSVTWIADDRLWQVDAEGGEPTCLLETGYPRLEWGGDADRVLIGDVVVVGDEIQEVGNDDLHLESLSRPTGTAVLATSGDGLVKVLLDGSDQLELATFNGSEEATYHPAGTAIVSVQPRGDRPGILLANNLGEDPHWLVDNESANELRDLTFTQHGSLLFAAIHDDGDTHVHRLDLDSFTLTTMLDVEQPQSVQRIAASPFADGNIAISRSEDMQLTDLWVQRDGERVNVAGTPVEHGSPIGWLPDGSLAVAVYEDDAFCCDVPSFDVYVLRSDGVERIAGPVSAAAVRAVLPPPPPPPANIDEAAPS